MKHYCINCGHELKDNQLNCPKCGHCIVLDIVKEEKNEATNLSSSIGSVLSARQIEVNTQWTKYRCGKGGLTGHGFAAEDANALSDILRGCEVDLSGRDNSKNGADRIVDGIKVQTKYCNTAKESVNAGFDFETGLFRYEGQVIEVPKDQYEEAVSIMKQKIYEGKVQGYTNPEDAVKLVKQGSVTYKQAKNIAKAGNIDSLWFDVRSQAINCLSALGVSFVIAVGLSLPKCKTRRDIDAVIQLALLQGLKAGTITMTSSVLNMQLIRTSFGRNLAAALTKQFKKGVDGIRSVSLGKNMIDRIASTINGKALHGAAARNVTVKFLRTNAIGNAIMLTVITMPDIYKCFFAKSISRPQFYKNLIVNTTSITGATLGAFLGAYGGPVVAILGGLAGGLAAGWASKKIADAISKDDSVKMKQLLEVALLQLCHDYLIQDEEEFSRCINYITNDKVISEKFLRAMYSIGADEDDDELRVDLAYKTMEYYFSVVSRQRTNVKVNEKRMLKSIDELAEILDEQ